LTEVNVIGGLRVKLHLVQIIIMLGVFTSQGAPGVVLSDNKSVIQDAPIAMA